MAEAKIIKRYANRKLYDTERSCYVTLDDIATIIRAGEEVRVLDNRTGGDLTSVTLAQIIFEAEKKSHFLSMDLLTKLIRNSGERMGSVREQIDAVQTRAQQWSADASDSFSDFSRKAFEVREQVEDVLSKTRSTLEDLHSDVESKVRNRIGTVSDTASREFVEIARRLKELRDRLERRK